MYRHKLLLVGAGPIGLAMGKALKDRGIAYDQIDAASAIGGNWQHGVYPSAHIVSSKRSTAYAGYPMPADYPDFPSAAQMLAYLQAYARDNALTEHIETGKKLIEARPFPDESWQARFADGETRIYKGVVVCNGHHWDPRMPTWPGTFAGQVIHAQAYKSPAQLAGKRVLVVGGGNSACDVASEAARVGASSDLSLRSGYWFLPKTAFGKPLTDLPIWRLPVFMQRIAVKTLIRLVIGDYRSYGLPRPTHKLFDRHPTFGTEILGYIRQGKIKPRPDVAKLDGKTVHFADGTQADYDLIVAATGYHNSFPFLAPGIVEVKNDAAQVYGGAFPTDVKNLYIVGSNQPRNGFGSLITPAAHLYARMIEMQDTLSYPIGAMLRWIGEPLPANNLVDPAKALRQIWVGERTLSFLKIYDRILPHFEARPRLPQEFYVSADCEAEAGSPVVDDAPKEPPVVRLLVNEAASDVDQNRAGLNGLPLGSLPPDRPRLTNRFR